MGAGLLAGLTLALAACSGGADSLPPVQPTTARTSAVTSSTSPAAGDRTAEVAGYESAAESALPVHEDAVSASSGMVTGADTPEGWQVQNLRDASYGGTAVGRRQFEVVCAGRGEVDVSVTVRAGGGDQVSVTPVPTTCSAQGTTSRVSFEVGSDDEGYDVDVVPAAGAVAVLGYVVT